MTQENPNFLGSESMQASAPGGYGGSPRAGMNSSLAASTTAIATPTAPGQPMSETAPLRLNLPPIRTDLVTRSERAEEVLRLAQEAFVQTDKWVLFYREILGVEGVMRTLFKTADEVRAFEEMPQFGQLLEMVTAVRAMDSGKGDELEPQKMITVRLPKSQHEAMKQEAAEHGTSINKLCISKLLLPIKSCYVPEEKGKLRGRKPGPQGSNNRLDATTGIG